MPNYNFRTAHGVLSISVRQVLKPTGERQDRLEVIVVPELLLGVAAGDAKIDDVRAFVFSECGGKPVYDNRRTIIRKVHEYVAAANSF